MFDRRAGSWRLRVFIGGEVVYGREMFLKLRGGEIERERSGRVERKEWRAIPGWVLSETWSEV